MPLLKLSNLLRPKTEASSLRERAVDLKDRLARSTRLASEAAMLGTLAIDPEPSPAAPQEDSTADAELLRLGQRFQAAAAREIEACATISVAATEAERHEPAFPACLTLTAADHGLNVYRYWTDPEALEGIKLNSGDVERLRRKMPMMHEVLRPIREGERAHIDHPGRKFDIVPHPEAQARAEAIVAAWDAWRAEMHRVCAEHVTPEMDREAEEAGDAAADLARQIAELPARTGAGLRASVRPTPTSPDFPSRSRAYRPGRISPEDYPSPTRTPRSL